jgi:hypothetical protein
MGAAFDIRWVNAGKLHDGAYCTMQGRCPRPISCIVPQPELNYSGVTQQFGESAVALSTLAIAIQTFIVVWVGRTGRTQSLRIAVTVVSLIWLFVSLFVGVSAGTHRNKQDLYIVFTPVSLPVLVQPL